MSKMLKFPMCPNCGAVMTDGYTPASDGCVCPNRQCDLEMVSDHSKCEQVLIPEPPAGYQLISSPAEILPGDLGWFELAGPEEQWGEVTAEDSGHYLGDLIIARVVQ